MELLCSPCMSAPRAPTTTATTTTTTAPPPTAVSDSLLCCLCVRRCVRGFPHRAHTGDVYVETLYATHVKSAKSVRYFLDHGGEPNSIPLFFDQQSHCVYRCFCCPCYCNGMVGEAVGPYDPKDFDAALCGNDEKGTADFAGGNRTLLHWAAYWQNPESIQALLNAGANLNVRSLKGMKPLDIAEFVDAPLRIRVLLGAKNDVVMVIDGLEYKGADARNSVDSRTSMEVPVAAEMDR